MAGGLAGTAAIMNLSAISLDRCLAISFPLHPGRKLSTKQAWLIIVFIWSYSLSFSVVPLFGIEGVAYVPEGNGHSCSFDYLSPNTNNLFFIWTYFVGAWVVPLVIIACSYTKIAVVARRHLLTRLESQHNRLEMSQLVAKNKYLHKLYGRSIPSESCVSQRAKKDTEEYDVKRAFFLASIPPANAMAVWLGFRFGNSLKPASSTEQRNGPFRASILKKSYSTTTSCPNASSVTERKRLYKHPTELPEIQGSLSLRESCQIHAPSTSVSLGPPQFRPRIRPRAVRSHRCNRIMHKVSREMRLTRIPGGLVLLWFCAWTPYAVVALLGISGYTSLLTPFSVVVPGLACKLAACVDPYVYALSHPRCKVELKKRLRALRQSFSCSSTRLSPPARSSEMLSASFHSTKTSRVRAHRQSTRVSLKQMKSENLSMESIPDAPEESPAFSACLQPTHSRKFNCNSRHRRSHLQKNFICDASKLNTLDEDTNSVAHIDESFSSGACDRNPKLPQQSGHENGAVINTLRSCHSSSSNDFSDSDGCELVKNSQNSNLQGTFLEVLKIDDPSKGISSIQDSSNVGKSMKAYTSEAESNFVTGLDYFQPSIANSNLLPLFRTHLEQNSVIRKKILKLPNSRSEHDFTHPRKLDTIIFLKTDFASVYSSPLTLLARPSSTDDVNSVSECLQN